MTGPTCVCDESHWYVHCNYDKCPVKAFIPPDNEFVANAFEGALIEYGRRHLTPEQRKAEDDAARAAISRIFKEGLK